MKTNFMIQSIFCLIVLALPLSAQPSSRLRLQESTELLNWKSIAITPEMIDANGRLVIPTDSGKRFYRMQVELIRPPSLIAQPSPASVVSGSTTTLSGTGPFTYQWYKGTVGVTTSPVGTNSPFFTTPPELTETTTYWVRVTNEAGTADSALATVALEPEFALIPEGVFTMGRTSGDDANNAPTVKVTVSDFYMGKNEVTKALWDEVRTWAVDNGYTDLATGEGKASDHPVYRVSWFDAVKWCNARSEKAGLTPVYTSLFSGAVMKTGTAEPSVNWTANGYRLPTEAEWEKAARGGVSGKRFPWGTDTISHSDANYYSSSFTSYDSSAADGWHPAYWTGDLPFTSPVGSFTPNAYGLNDMAGNVYEWCWDWYGASAYVNGATNPHGPVAGSNRVIRGGVWVESGQYCRVWDRGHYPPTSASWDEGFRLTRRADPLAFQHPPVPETLLENRSSDGN